MNQQYQNLYQSGTPYSTPPVSPTDSTNPTFVKHLILSIAQLFLCPYTLGIPLILTILLTNSNGAVIVLSVDVKPDTIGAESPLA